MNKAGAGGDGPILTRLTRIATEIGPYKLMTVGLGARSVVVEVAVRRGHENSKEKDCDKTSLCYFKGSIGRTHGI